MDGGSAGSSVILKWKGDAEEGGGGHDSEFGERDEEREECESGGE